MPFGPVRPFGAIPPITEVPDYVWSRQHDKPCYLPGRPVRKPEDTSIRISHPDAESALRAAKCACRGRPGRWFGRGSSDNEKTAFLVYEGGKIVERHFVRA